jgi:pyruvate/2-oxoacid:ferredoxin oxidoreductase alpha subunit
MHIIESGNTAAAHGVKLARAQVIAAYPITPQTPLTEKLSEFVAAGELDSQYIPVESEHSALGVCIAASSAGARAFTATSANGLLYMHEQIHWAAGARLPIVMCVVNRGVGAPWTIWNDHQDSMSQRDTGWIQLYACDHQQIIDTLIQGFRLAETVSIPVMVCYDGYILSHTYMPFDIPTAEKVNAFLPAFKPDDALDPKKPFNLNTVTMPDIRPDVEGHTAPGYMDIRHSLHVDLRTAIDELVAIDKEYQDLFGRGGNPLVETYCCDDAEVVAVSIGSLSYQLRAVVDELRDEGLKVGSAGVRMYRPFPDQALVELLSDKKRVVVFEKAVSYGNQGPLYSDLKSALYRQATRPEIENFILGLGGRTIKTNVLASKLRDVCQGSGAEDDAPRFIGIRVIGNRE